MKSLNRVHAVARRNAIRGFSAMKRKSVRSVASIGLITVRQPIRSIWFDTQTASEISETRRNPDACYEGGRCLGSSCVDRQGADDGRSFQCGGVYECFERTC